VDMYTILTELHIIQAKPYIDGMCMGALCDCRSTSR